MSAHEGGAPGDGAIQDLEALERLRSTILQGAVTSAAATNSIRFGFQVREDLPHDGVLAINLNGETYAGNVSLQTSEFVSRSAGGTWIDDVLERSVREALRDAVMEAIPDEVVASVRRAIRERAGVAR